MTTIVIHPATKIYLDFGSELGRESGVILRTNGQLMTFEQGKDAAKELERWQAELAASPGVAISVAMGEHITRKTDMNPHGLV